jgi:hypothetical protein
MSSTRAIANFISLMAVAGLTIGFAAQRTARIQAETEHASLKHQLEILRSIASENAQLSNLVAHTTAPKILPGDESGELLRLRAEVSELRRQCADLKNVLTENHQAHAAPGLSSGSSATDAIKTPDYWPRDSWAFAGYTTPDAALQSSLWAANNGDLKGVLASTTGDLRASLEKDLAAKSEAEISIGLMDEVGGVESIRVLDRMVQPDGTVLITAAFVGKYDTQTRKLILQKVGEDWKIAERPVNL